MYKAQVCAAQVNDYMSDFEWKLNVRHGVRGCRYLLNLLFCLYSAATGDKYRSLHRLCVQRTSPGLIEKCQEFKDFFVAA